MGFPVKAFAKMARASGFSKEDAKAKLQGKAPEQDLIAALDAAYSKSVEVLQAEFSCATSEAMPAILTGDSKSVDAQGLDEADRATIAVMVAMDED